MDWNEWLTYSWELAKSGGFGGSGGF